MPATGTTEFYFQNSMTIHHKIVKIS